MIRKLTQSNSKVCSILVCSIIFLFCIQDFVFSLPEVEQVVSGTAQISQPNSTTLQITADNNAIINYSSFNISENESVVINLPSADGQLLNRVLGNSASQLLGNLNSNGLFVLVNPSGIYIGPKAAIDAASVIMSTRDINNSDFLNGNYLFQKLTQDQLNKLLLNEGTITVEKGGFGILIAGGIENKGKIIAPTGTIALAAGDAVRIDIAKKGFISVAVEKETSSNVLDAEGNPITDQIKNTGTIESNGGSIILDADSASGVFKQGVNLQGYVTANKLESKDGVLRIVADQSVNINATVKATNIEVGSSPGKIPENVEIAGGSMDAENSITILAKKDITINANLTAQGIIHLEGQKIIDLTSTIKANTLKLTGQEFLISTNAINLEVTKTLNDFVISKSSSLGDLVTLEGDSIKLTYLITSHLTLKSDNPIRTTGTAIISAQKVSLLSNKFGNYDTPVRISADELVIHRLNGTIEIAQSTDQGGNISIRGPPTDSFSIEYNKNAQLTLKAEKVTVSSDSSTYFYGNITFYNFIVTTPFKAIYFEPGKTYTFKDSVNIEVSDAVNASVWLLSQQEGSQWNINVDTENWKFYKVVLQDSNNVSSKELRASPSNNWGNNSRWIFNTVYWNAPADGNWNLGSNWNTGVAPATSDAVVFDSRSVAACSINSLGNWSNGTITIGGTLSGNYSGTITISPNVNMTINDFTMEAGSTGIFNAGNSILSINHNFNVSGGTFNGQTSTVIFQSSGGNAIWTAGGTYYNVQVAVSVDFSLAVTGTATVNGNFTYTSAGAMNTGTINVAGNLIIGNSNGGGSATIVLNGTGDQTITGGAATTMAALKINKASGTAIMSGNFNLGSNKTFTMTAGTFDLNGNTATTANFTYTAGTIAGTGGGIFNVTGAFTGIVGTWNSGTNLRFSSTANNQEWTTGSVSYANVEVVKGASYILTVTGTATVAGNFTYTSASTMSTGTVNVAGNLTVGSGAPGGTTTIVLNGTGAQLITFTAGTMPSLTINNTGTASLASNLTVPAGRTLSISSGGKLATASYTLTVSGTFSNDGTLQLQGGETLTLTADTNSGTVEYVGSGSTSYSSLIYGNTYNHLKINSTSGTNSFSPNGTLTVNGNLTITSGTLNINGQSLILGGSSAFANTGTLKLLGSETIANLTMVTNSGTIEYAGTSLYSLLKLGNTYNHLTFSNTGTYSLNAALTVNGNLTISNASGILNLNGQNLIYAAGSAFSNIGTLKLIGSEAFTNLKSDTDSGTVEYAGFGTYAGLAAGIFYFNLKFSGNGTYNLNANVDVNGALTFTGYSYKKTITIDNTKVDTDLTNFPILYSVVDANLATTANGGRVTNASGFDIVFVGSNGAILSHEIESYTASNGTFVSWVKIPSLVDATDTQITMYYANSNVTTSQENPGGVWDINYAGVWHLDEIMTDEVATGTNTDSTSNANNGTQNGNDDIAGQIGTGQNFDGTNDFISLGNKATLNYSSFTIETWAKTSVSAWRWLVTKAGGSWLGTSNTGNLNWTRAAGTNYTSSQSISNNAWHHGVATFNSGSLILYVDKVSVGSWTGVTLAVTAANTFIGQRGDNLEYFNGSMDEVRISNIARSPQWISTEYNNQNSPSTFSSTGAEAAASGATLGLGISYNVNVAGNYSNNGSHSVTGTGAVIFDGAATQTLNSGAVSIPKVTISNTTPNGVQLITNHLTVTNTLTIDANALLDLNAKNLIATGATISNSGTIQLQGGETLTDFTNDTVKGTVKYNGTGSYTGLAAGNYYFGLTFNGSGTWTLNAALDTNGAFTIAQGIVDAAGQSLTVGGNWVNSGTFTSGLNTVTFDGGSIQTINAGGTANDVKDFNNLTVSGSTLQLTGTALEVDGTLTINASKILDLNSQSLTLGILANNGTFQLTGGEAITVTTWDADSGLVKYTAISGSRDIKDFGATDYYNLEIAGNGGTFTLGASALKVANNFTVSNGIFNGGTQNIDVDGNVALDGGTLTATSGSFTVGGNWTRGIGTFTPGTNTVTFDATALEKTITSGGSAFYHISFNGNGGSWILQDALDVDGNLTIGIGATLDTKSGSNWGIAVAGNWANTGTFTARNGTVTLDGSGTSTISGTTTFYRLTSTTAGKTISFTSGTTQTISNKLTLTGTSGNLITLSRSDGLGADQWNINLQAGATQTLSYLSVANVNASGLSLIAGTTSTNGGNNTSWIFTVTTFTWDGSSSTAWATADNWDLGAVPTSGDEVVLADVANDPSLGANTTVAILTVNAGTIFNLNNYTLTVSSTLTNNGTINALGSGTPITAGTLTGSAGSTVTYLGAAGTVSATVAEGTYGNLTINGASDSFNLGNGITVQGNLTITNGTLAAGTKNIALAGNFNNAGTFNAGTGTVTFNKSSGVQTLNSGGSNFYAITHNAAGTLQLTTNNLTVTNAFTNSAGGFDLNGKNLTATGATISNSGTIQLQGGETLTGFVNDTVKGTIRYNGTADYTTTPGILAAGSNYYHLTFDGVGGQWKLNAAVDVNGNFTITNGTVDANGQNMNVAGNWARTGGTFTPGTGTVTFDGAGTSVISGSNSFFNLTSTTAGKTLSFTSGTTQTITNTLTLTGAVGNLITLSRNGGSGVEQWNMNVQAGATSSVSYVSVSNANATGSSILAGSTSTNGGNNTAWIFGAATYTWAGTSSINWGTGSNWDLGAVPGSTDTAIIADVVNDPMLGANTAVSILTINSGALLNLNNFTLTVTNALTNNGSITASGAGTPITAGSLTTTNPSSTITYTGAAGGVSVNVAGGTYGNLTINGASDTFNLPSINDIIVQGNLNITTGILSAGARNITVAGNWSNLGSFSAGTSTVTFNGNSLSIISGANTFFRLACTTGGKALSFASGVTQTVTNLLTLTGASGSLITLSRNGGSGQWYLNAPLSTTVNYVSVSNSNSTNPITANNSFNGGNNLNWNFGSIDYSGGSYGGGFTPGANESVAISSGTMTLSSTATYQSLGINPGASFNFGGQNLIASGGITNQGNLIFTGNETVTGTITNAVGSLVSYTGGGIYASLAGGTSYYDVGFSNGNHKATGLTVNRNLTVGSGVFEGEGTIAVSGNLNGDGGTLNFANATNLTVDGDINLNGGATFTPPPSGFILKGRWVNNTGSTITIPTAQLTGAATQIIDPRNTIFTNFISQGPVQLTNGPLVAGTLDIRGTFDSNGQAVTASSLILGGGGTINANSDFTISGDVNLGNGTLITTAGKTITVGGGWSNTGNNTIISSAVVFNGQGTKALNLSNSVFNGGITVSEGTVQLADTGTINSTVRVTGGTFDTNGRTATINELTVTGGGSFVRSTAPLYVSGNFTLGQGANWTGSGAVNFTGNLVINTAGQNLGNVVIGASPDTITLNSDLVADSLTINSLDTLNTNGYNLTIGSGGITIATGATLNAAGSGTIALGGNWSNSGTFTPGTGTVSFSGSSVVNILGNTTFNNLSVTTAGKEIRFANGSTQTVAGALTLTGSSGNLVKLQSSVSGSQWKIDARGTKSISHVYVKDSNNINTAALSHTNSLNLGNNINWGFASASTTANFFMSSRVTDQVIREIKNAVVVQRVNDEPMATTFVKQARVEIAPTSSTSRTLTIAPKETSSTQSTENLKSDKKTSETSLESNSPDSEEEKKEKAE